MKSMKPGKYVCIIQSMFNHAIDTADRVEDFPKRVKNYINNKDNNGEWILFKAGDDGKVHRCYANGRKIC
jgi:hypothetical protein